MSALLSSPLFSVPGMSGGNPNISGLNNQEGMQGLLRNIVYNRLASNFLFDKPYGTEFTAPQMADLRGGGLAYGYIDPSWLPQVPPPEAPAPVTIEDILSPGKYKGNQEKAGYVPPDKVQDRRDERQKQRDKNKKGHDSHGGSPGGNDY